MNSLIINLFLLTSIASAVFFLVLLVYFNSLSPKSERNRFANSFPSEFFRSFTSVQRTISYVVLGINLVCSAVGISSFFFGLNSNYAIVLAIIFALGITALIFSFYLPLEYYKAHIALSSFGFFFFASPCLLFAFIELIPGAIYDTSRLLLPMEIIVGVIGLALLLSLFNPKLFRWAKMEKTEIDGKTVYVKPKINFYALYEWIFFGGVNLVSFLLFLDVILTGN